MPPHGGHGGGGHHHHGGGGFVGPGWGGWGGWWDPYPSTSVVVIDPSDDKKEQQAKLHAGAMKVIMSLPKGQRVAAYKKMFGENPPGALSDFADWMKQPWFYIGAGLGLGAMYLLFRKGGGKRRRR